MVDERMRNSIDETGIGGEDDASPAPGDSQVRYLEVGPEWAHSRYHAGSGDIRDIAILFCAPFGFEEICSQRPLREWAGHLARDGHPCLRLTLPGVGDSSGGPWDPDRLDVWTRAVRVAADWLRATSGARRVVAIGIGLGGLLAYRAASIGGGLDGLVLWATPPRGSELIRQLRAFSRMESSEFFPGIDPPPALPEGSLQAGGFVMSPETVTALKALDLAELRAPELELGVLVLTLDGVAPGKLLQMLAEQGLDAREADGTGFGAMTADPQSAAIPKVAMGSVGSWLAERSGTAHSSVPPAGEDHPDLISDDALCLPSGASEHPWTLLTPSGRMRGILCRPDPARAPLGVIFFNAGGVPHVGPNRMWVEAARRWGALGMPSLRVDMPGLGESDGPATAYPENAPFYSPALVDRARAVIGDLQRRRVAERFVLVGLCSGSYWALHAGLAEDCVAGILLLNPVLIHWDDGIGASRDLRRVFADRSWRLVRKNATPERVWAVVRLLVSTPLRVLRRLLSHAPGGPPSFQARVDATLESLERADTRLFIAFSVREGLADELERTGWMARLSSWPHVAIRRIPVNDHTFRPVGIQELVHSEIDGELTRVLALCVDRPADGVAGASSR